MGNSLNPFKKQSPSIAYQPLLIPLISENENLRVFSFKELNKATKKFKQERVVEADNGSVQRFYKGYINETTFAPSRTKTVSVVEYYQYHSPTLKEWMEEVKSIGQISHPNLVKLLGYSCEENEKRFLVFEYMQKGSLDRHIFGKEEVLPWEIRVKIAIGTAQGIEFLHSVRNSLLHVELRLHNIMLDEQYNAKLLHLVSNQQRLEKENRTILGGFEYFAPEYAISGHRGTNTDVYTFGVILLELFSGLKALDTKRNRDKQKLAVWAESFLSGNYNIREIIDPRLGCDYPVNAATQMCRLIKRCIEQDRRKRPSMQQVYVALKEICRD
ncbi:hypothetical protein AALP_AA8G110400 [Arabis alpina]|uniref:Protein kinase domain-containing protein n=1 Tax=Arabis alpina TaxID=50452 RepID=A0A087G6A4_ARAAL|nr:hypothetical protein AALP_AA8G110400 [Arabis alpina]